MLRVNFLTVVMFPSGLQNRSEYIWSWLRKPMLGEAIVRRFVTKAMASFAVIEFVAIRYAHTTVAERDTPIRQCT